jgi:hypothetical protein
MTLYLTDSQKELTIKAILSEINYHQQKINSWVELYRKLQSEQTDVNPPVMQAEGSYVSEGAAVASMGRTKRGKSGRGRCKHEMNRKCGEIFGA